MIKWPLICIGRKYAGRKEMVPPQAREGDRERPSRYLVGFQHPNRIE